MTKMHSHSTVVSGTPNNGKGLNLSWFLFPAALDRFMHNEILTAEEARLDAVDVLRTSQRKLRRDLMYDFTEKRAQPRTSLPSALSVKAYIISLCSKELEFPEFNS